MAVVHLDSETHANLRKLKGIYLTRNKNIKQTKLINIALLTQLKKEEGVA